MKKLALVIALVTPVIYASPQKKIKNTPSTSNRGTSSTALLCKMKNLSEKNEIDVSVVLRESEKTVRVNDEVYAGVDFDLYRINASSSSPDFSVPGVIRKTSITLDRITGSMIWMTLPAPADNEKFTEEQKVQINMKQYPSFVGSCTPSHTKF